MAILVLFVLFGVLNGTLCEVLCVVVAEMLWAGVDVVVRWAAAVVEVPSVLFISAPVIVVEEAAAAEASAAALLLCARSLVRAE